MPIGVMVNHADQSISCLPSLPHSADRSTLPGLRRSEAPCLRSPYGRSPRSLPGPGMGEVEQGIQEGAPSV